MTMQQPSTKMPHSHAHPCPICGGFDKENRGKGTRCFGYTAGDYCYCTREEFAGNAPYNENAKAYSHYLKGECKCGKIHGNQTPSVTLTPANKPIKETVWSYETIEGKPVHQVIRRDYIDGRKEYTQRLIGEKGNYIYSLKGFQRILYQLPALVKSTGIIYIAEGEKCCDALAAKELTATTNPEGAAKFNSVDVSPLHNRDIVILPDHDQAGKSHTENILKTLNGVARTIRIIELPGLSDRGDIYDWFQGGHTKEELLQLVHRSEPIQTNKKLIECIISAKDLLNLDIPEIDFIAGEWIHKSSLSMVYAQTKIGKTYLCLEMAISMASGTDFLYWDIPKPRNVLYCEGDLPLIDIKKRITMIHRGRDMVNFRILSSKYLYDNKKHFFINDKNSQCEFEVCLKELEETGFIPDVIFFDNLSCLTSCDENSGDEQKEIIHWFNSLRHKEYAIIIVHHSGKSGDQRGTSKRLDQLDTVIKLTRPPVPKNAGAEFDLTFEYTRGSMPNPHKVHCELVENSDQQLEWILETPKQQHKSKQEEALSIIIRYEVTDTKDLSLHLNTSERTARRYFNSLKGKGYIDDEWNVTNNGFASLPDADDEYAPF